ncbi:SHOCT domain-containing protein [Rhabdothermincola salaria]|uniref:SHOCT domain-containing protein n=1 Tax=Rhabdothermincola salaria TaxID=2903142 RepID=UPI001E40CD73|nr:SHOCT domain-containing protein [Rhabdothermincola salaria]MCD9624377.1 SHOCT domain-containing protein [Rhabdothermincola salaria]
MVFAAEWGTGQVFLTILYFFLFFIWIMLLFQVFMDLFNRDFNGWLKAGWVVVLLALPYLGVFIYLIVNGGKMAKNQMKMAEDQKAAMDSYIREAASTATPAEQLAQLADLHDRGKLSDAEYESMKAKVVA